jgi:hypothetical protein
MTDQPRFWRKKPVVIEARQFDGSGECAGALMEWMGDNGACWNDDETMCIPTLEGTHTASAGDWIVKGVQGEFYPCKPDIFAMTYEVADD